MNAPLFLAYLRSMLAARAGQAPAAATGTIHGRAGRSFYLFKRFLEPLRGRPVAGGALASSALRFLRGGSPGLGSHQVGPRRRHDGQQHVGGLWCAFRCRCEWCCASAYSAFETIVLCFLLFRFYYANVNEEDG